MNTEEDFVTIFKRTLLLETGFGSPAFSTNSKMEDTFEGNSLLPGGMQILFDKRSLPTWELNILTT